MVSKNNLLEGLDRFYSANLTLFQMWIKTHRCLVCMWVKKAAKIRNRYNQVPHLTQDTTWESDKNTFKHHKQDPRGQPFPSRWSQGSNEQTQKHDKHKT